MEQMVKNLPAVQETRVPFLGQEDALEKEMATPSSRVHHEKGWAGRLTGWNQDCQEKYQ